MAASASEKLAVRRLCRDLAQLQTQGNPQVAVQPSSQSMLEWHFVLHDLPADTPYKGGRYHGKLIFPENYPHAPPAIIMLTPNGRLETNRRICLTMSDYHPESWNPAWSIESILVGLVSFMIDERDPVAIGVLNEPAETRARLAEASHEFNMSTAGFHELFPEFCSAPQDPAVPVSEDHPTLAETSDAASDEGGPSSDVVVVSLVAEPASRAWPSERMLNTSPAAVQEEEEEDEEDSEDPLECWICRDSTSPEPLIQPCACRGSMSGVHASCVEAWIRHYRTNAQNGNEAPKCSVCKQPYEGTERRPGPLGFVREKSCNFCKQASRSALLVGMLFAYWIGVREDVVREFIGKGVDTEDDSTVSWELLGAGACLGQTGEAPRYFTIDTDTVIVADLPDTEAPQLPTLCQDVCQGLGEACQGASVKSGDSKCLVHITGELEPEDFVSGPTGADGAIISAGAWPEHTQSEADVKKWACYLQHITEVEEPELTGGEAAVVMLMRVVLLLSSGVFFAHKTLVLSLSLPRGRLPPEGIWRHFFVGDFRKVALHIAEAAASLFIAGLWSIYGELPFYYFLPLSAMALGPLCAAVALMDSRSGTCTYRMFALLALLLASPVLVIVHLVRAILARPQRLVDPFDGLLHILIPVVTLPMCWFSKSNAPVIIMWSLHTMLLVPLLVEKVWIQRVKWKDGRVWWIFIQLAILSAYVGNLLHRFETGFAKEHSELLVLGVSAGWLLASCSLVILVNWQQCVSHYRAWQQRHGSFTLTSTSPTRASQGAQIIGVTQPAAPPQGEAAEQPQV